MFLSKLMYNVRLYMYNIYKLEDKIFDAFSIIL